MTTETNKMRNRKWAIAITAGAVLTVCLLAVGAVALYYDNLNRVDTSTSTQIPLLGSSQVTGFGDVAVSESGVSSLGGVAGLLRLRLSEGSAQPVSSAPLAVVPGDPLSEEETAQLLDRLPPLEEEGGDVVGFQLPDEVLPPPLTGETIEESFPPPAAPEVAPEVVSGPLEVLRYSPEGEVPLAPFISVTFNQPMVPLGTLSDLAELDVPLTIQPELPGVWRWAGTKTLTFEYDSELIDRLPQATEYTITVPAGVESANGNSLAEAVSWRFTTPPPGMITGYPQGEAQPLEPTFFISFDQRIDPQAMLDAVTVTADGSRVSTRLATQEEVEGDEEARWMAENTPEGRWLAFKAAAPLPASAQVSVVIPAGAPSAEGPLRTTVEQSYTFRTYSPLEVVDHGCSWGSDSCPPLTPFYIEFNNPIDPRAYDPAMLVIEPALPGANVQIFGSTINIQGVTAGRTNYRVTVSADIQDVFGQTLGSEETLIFRVGSAEPVLSGPNQDIVILDPAAERPTLSYFTINYDELEVKAYEVSPSDWPAYQSYLQDYNPREDTPTPPGRLVWDETISTEGTPDALTEVTIDLSEALPDGAGHLALIVRPPDSLLPNDDWRPTIQTWVQATEIGLDAFVDHSEVVAWATSLRDGAPLGGVTLIGDDGSTLGTTAGDGTARFDLPEDGLRYVVAEQGDDRALLPAAPYRWGDYAWQPYPPMDELRWYLFDDRQMYRPGEEVHIKGWLRQIGGMQDGDVGLVGDTVSNVSYLIYDPQGNELAAGESEVSVLGGFDFAFTIPDNANLGFASVQLRAEGRTADLAGIDGYHGFQIQEFRRPEFEVSARNETTGPYYVGGEAVVAVSASYFAGGPLPNAEVTWTVASTPGSYSPPNWPDFTFGKWIPWWMPYDCCFDFGVAESSFYPPEFAETTYETFSGLTDATGNHYLRLEFDENPEPRPYSIQADASVMDVNRQAWAAGTSLLVHPSELYVGLRSEQTFVERGEPLEIGLIVTDVDGNPVSGRPIEVKAGRLEWQFGENGWAEEEVDVQECTPDSAQEPVTCTFETELGGSYQITAVVTDTVGRQNLSQFTRWVSGGKQPPAREVAQESVTLIPDKEQYQPGDTAQVLVQTPFSPAELLVTVSRSGILYTERRTLSEGSMTLSIPIAEAHIPNLQVQVDAVGAAPRTNDEGEELADLPPRPAFATGQLTLNIPPASRELTLEITPQETELPPGGETTIDLLLTDANGAPVGDAELAVVVVDEAILALSSYTLTDPLSVFYNIRSSYVESHYSRSSIVLANPDLLAARESAMNSVEVQREVEEAAMEEGEAMFDAMATMPAEMPAPEMAAGAAPGDDSAGPPPIQVRSDFNPLAIFAPEVRTGADGRAQVPVQLPDNLTRYRIMVVAVAGENKFGSAEANLTARLPLMVRPSAPRFLNFGDQFELPVVIQNQTEEALTVDVAVAATNLSLTEGAGRRVTVPANDRIEVRFPAEAASAGTARIQVAAASGEYADAATVELPVYTPATTEAFATYGVLDEGAVAQPILPPSDVFPQFGSLEIGTSSTALQALTDAVLYLVTYPHSGSEQLASEILAISALRDVLTAFSAEGLPTPEEMNAAVEDDIEQLQGMQNFDGGFPYWQRGWDSIPFNSIHVAHALQIASEKGYETPAETISGVHDYLRNIESYYPEYYSEETKQALTAYALYVRHLMGDNDTAKARGLIEEAGLENLSLEAVAWLWQVLLSDPGANQSLIDAIERHIANRAIETAGAANFTTDYGDDAYLMLHSDRRTDAIILDALIAGNPESDLIPKVVNGLLAHRTRGRWGNTQENVFVLLALDRYFQTFEAETPDFVARMWLGDTYVGSHAYAGRTTERHETDIPMSYLVSGEWEDGQPDLILEKDGAGRLYYRLGLSYAPTDLQLDPLDMGFEVQRRYEAVDNPDDVFQDEEGVWHIKAGARVRVLISLVASNRRYHVALTDPLPAGLEIVNPALAVSGPVPQDPGSPDFRYGWWWWGTWYEHQNMRDESAQAYASLLWDGVYEYSYVTRATTPGTFIVPPAKAEELYSPEVFGRSGSDLVIVE